MEYYSRFDIEEAPKIKILRKFELPVREKKTKR
jgi:hypothetical protein